MQTGSLHPHHRGLHPTASFHIMAGGNNSLAAARKKTICDTSVDNSSDVGSDVFYNAELWCGLYVILPTIVDAKYSIHCLCNLFGFYFSILLSSIYFPSLLQLIGLCDVFLMNCRLSHARMKPKRFNDVDLSVWE